MRAWALLLLSMTLGLQIHAADEAYLQQQRTELERQWRSDMDACLGRFAVSGCQNEATQRYYQQDKVLQDGLLTLHKQQRLESAEQKRKELKQREQDFLQELEQRSQQNLSAPKESVSPDVPEKRGSLNKSIAPVVDVEQARLAYSLKLEQVQQRRLAREKRLDEAGGDKQYLPIPQ